MAIGLKPQKNKKNEDTSEKVLFSIVPSNPKARKIFFWLLISLVVEGVLFLGGIIMLKHLGF